MQYRVIVSLVLLKIQQILPALSLILKRMNNEIYNFNTTAVE